MQNGRRVLLEQLVRCLDQPASPVVGDVALISRKLGEQLIRVALMLYSVVAVAPTHHIIKMSLLLRQVQLRLHALQVDLELLDRVVLCHHLDGTLKSYALILQLVPSNCLLDERNVRCEVAAQLHRDLTE